MMRVTKERAVIFMFYISVIDNFHLLERGVVMLLQVIISVLCCVAPLYIRPYGKVCNFWTALRGFWSKKLDVFLRGVMFLQKGVIVHSSRHCARFSHFYLLLSICFFYKKSKKKKENRTAQTKVKWPSCALSQIRTLIGGAYG